MGRCLILKILNKKISDLKEYENNPRINDDAVEYVKKSIEEFGYKVPIVIDKNNVIIAGHTRLKALKELGVKNVDCVIADDLSEEQVKAFRLADNKVSEASSWDWDKLGEELNTIPDIDMSEFGFDLDSLDTDLDDKEIVEDEVPEVPEEPKAKLGDIYQLGNHRLMCGDSTDEEQVKQLMDGKLADMVFTDPPYGMKKENEGVANDNLNFDDLLEFNKKWIPFTFKYTKDNGSWYCWGIDEPLMDIYSSILKPMIKNQKITFRNLLTWDKGNGQGQMSEEIRMYPIADEKCLFVQCGVQGYNNNADNYFENWESIRQYLLHERKKCGWDVPTMKTIAGHSSKSRDHWTNKSQWNLPTEEVYIKFQSWAKEHNIDAFKREYDDIKREYDDIKREFYKTRAYFNNTHDNMNNVWHFDRPIGEEKASAGGHATPKPIALCSRAIESSSRENEIVLDLFGGSGSTMIACEQLNRKCYMMELEPKWVDVIIQRWENFTGKKAVKIKGE